MLVSLIWLLKESFSTNNKFLTVCNLSFHRALLSKQVNWGISISIPFSHRNYKKTSTSPMDRFLRIGVGMGDRRKQINHTIFHLENEIIFHNTNYKSSTFIKWSHGSWKLRNSNQVSGGVPVARYDKALGGATSLQRRPCDHSQRASIPGQPQRCSRPDWSFPWLVD
jgi:hypothetical protein